MSEKLVLTDAEWRERLTPEEYEVLRGHGTERAWTGCFLGTKEPGIYACAGCGNPLFRSGEKFESGTGWPSFTEPLSRDALVEHTDHSYGMRARRGPLRPVRWSPRPRLPRRTAADRAAVLHELDRAPPRAGRRAPR